MNLKILPRDLKTKDLRALLQSVMMQWLPLSKAVLITVVEQLPPPAAAQKERMPHIIELAPGSAAVSDEVRNAMVNFDPSPAAPVIAYVSKMVSIPQKELNKVPRIQLTAEEMRELGREKAVELARQLVAKADAAQDLGSEDDDDDDAERLIGFARVYSGTIRAGQELYVLGPKYSPLTPDQHIQKVRVANLYYMMGRDLEVLTEVPAGNVFAIAGLEGKLLKNGTITSVASGGLNLAGVSLGSAPIVRVALEPKNPSQMKQLIAGMKLLEQADPCAEYIVQDNGEHVILTAGELHLEVCAPKFFLFFPSGADEKSQRCLKDLRERYAKIDIQSSEPIVPFRETIVSAAEMSPLKDPNLPRGTVVAITPSKHITVRIRTRPLPRTVTDFLVQNGASIKSLYSTRRAQGQAEGGGGDDDHDDHDEADEKLVQGNLKLLGVDEVKKGLQKAFSGAPAKERDIWAGVLDKLTAFGPRRIGPNLLIDNTKEGSFRKL